MTKNYPTLPLASTHPTVLKAYAFLAHLLQDEPESPHPYIITAGFRRSSCSTADFMVIVTGVVIMDFVVSGVFVP
ncbi:18333_t:CDS:2, partial [Dentiscutata erythropus]